MPHFQVYFTIFKVSTFHCRTPAKKTPEDCARYRCRNSSRQQSRHRAGVTTSYSPAQTVWE